MAVRIAMTPLSLDCHGCADCHDTSVTWLSWPCELPWHQCRLTVMAVRIAVTPVSLDCHGRADCRDTSVAWLSWPCHECRDAALGWIHSRVEAVPAMLRTDVYVGVFKYVSCRTVRGSEQEASRTVSLPPPAGVRRPRSGHSQISRSYRWME
jgi:hypothetical protein